MIQALVSLKSLIKTKSYHIDHPVFRLHYQATVGVLLAFCLILTAKVLFGDPIDCRSRNDNPPGEWADNFCFSQGTYTKYYSKKTETIISRTLISEVDGNQIQFTTNTSLISPEGDSTESEEVVVTNNNENNDNSQTYFRYFLPGIPLTPVGLYHEKPYWHRYYQYMSIVLFLQAVFFYFPHYLWKYWENGIVSSICKQLHENRFSPSEFIESNYHIIDYLQNCFTLHSSLVYKYFFCEVLLIANLIAQVIVLDVIFNNQFILYGSNVIKFWFFDQDIYHLRDQTGSANPEMNSPMNFVFPKVTMCNINTQAQTGEVETHNYICILKLNILHDKFFFILWIWLLILAVITVIQIIFDVLYITIPYFRKYLFMRRFGPYLTQNTEPPFTLTELFLLDLIGNNSDKFAFSALLNKLNNSGLV